MAKLACLLAVAFSLAAPPLALAKTKVVVFPIVPIPGEVEISAAKEMTQELIGQLSQAGDFEVVLGTEPVPEAAAADDSGRRPAKPQTDYKAALESVAQGKQHAQRLRFPQAISALRKGIDGLTASIELVTNYDELVEAHLLLAVAYFRRGKESSGTDVLEHLARLRPTLELNASEYPPLFLRVFEQAKERALKRDRGAVRVTSAPTGAEVLLNGKSLGATPLLIESIVPGDNHLVVVSGAERWGQVVAVREGQTVEVHADIGAGSAAPGGGMSDHLAANRFDRDVRLMARKAAREAGGAYVVVGVIGATQHLFSVGAFLGNTRNGKWTALDPVSPDVDMLSASIEADKLARDVVAQIASFKATVVDDVVPLVAGKRMGSSKPRVVAREGRVTFVPADLGAAGGREPVATREPVSRGPVVAAAPAVDEVTPERGPVMPAAAGAEAGGATERRPLTRERGPITRETAAAEARQPIEEKREPVAAAPDTKVAAVVDPPLEQPPPSKGQRGPLTRDSARGPVISDAVGIDRGLDESSAEAARLAAVPISEGQGPQVGATDPMAPVDLRASAGMYQPFWNEWWFWTAVGVGAVAVAGSTYYFFLYDRPVESVTLHMDWAR